MRKYRFGITCFLAFLLIVFIAGCGQETVNLPSVVSTTPAPGAIDVVINTTISATFSMAMNPATITATTFTVTGTGGSSVAGVVSYTGTVATFTPSANLAYGTLYTATINTGATNPGGRSLIADYVWTFTPITPPPAITPAPTVILTSPVSSPENTNVSLNQVVSATFSEPMNSATIISANFTLTGPGTTSVAGMVDYAANGNQLVFAPSTNLAANTTYIATITTGAQDLADQPLANNYVWTFKTGATLNSIAPTLVSTIPGDTAPGVEATNVPLNQAISATFSEAMNPLNLSTATFQFYTGTGVSGTPISGTVSYDAINLIATLKPTALLIANTTYTATVTNGATDLAGNPLGTTVPSPFSNPWTFTTGAALVQPPVILGPTILLFGGFGGGAGITNQGINTVINGDIGTTAASSLITGFHDTSVLVGGIYECTYTETTLNKGLVNGAIDTAPGTSQPTAACPNEGTAHTFAIASEAALEALTAYNTLAAIPGGLDVSLCPGCGGGNAGELGNRTLAPGIYKSAPGSYGITAGNLTLDAKGNPNAYWVFQMSSSLTVGTPTSPESVLLVNGAQASNVFWQVGGLPGVIINYGGGGTMVGTIISQPGITISSPGQSTSSTVSTINGRVLALDASVTMVNTVINVP
ncbi:MAG: Ig-like domain-containing protein [Terracidiphilus sp.]|jgi:hypothetical protein